MLIKNKFIFIKYKRSIYAFGQFYSTIATDHVSTPYLDVTGRSASADLLKNELCNTSIIHDRSSCSLPLIHRTPNAPAIHNVYNASLSIKNDIEEVSMMVDELKDDFLPPSSFSNSPFLERMIPVQLSYERINYKDSKDMKVIDFQL